MSFAATAALLALRDSMPQKVPTISLPSWLKTLQAFMNGLKLTLLSSIVASLATTPFGLAYFNRLPIYGVIANLFEAPITTFIIMPCLAIGTVLISTPIGDIALFGADFGLKLVANLASTIANLPEAVLTKASGTSISLGVSAYGVFIICLFKGRFRWFGLILATAIFYWPTKKIPNLWIDQNGANAAIIINKTAYPLRPKVKQYGVDQLVTHYALKRADVLHTQLFFDCKGMVCLPKSNQRALSIGFWFGIKPPNPLVLETLCQSSRLVVIRSQVDVWPQKCANTNRITAEDLKTLGALELSILTHEWHFVSSNAQRGVRPWIQKTLSNNGDDVS
jgi:competence protein ComEC